MKRLLLVLVATSISCAPAAPAGTADDEAARWERQAQSITIIRDTLGHPAHLRQDRRRRGVRRDVRAGRRRLQSRRDQLPQCDGPARRGRGRVADLPRPADEAVHRSRRSEGAVREEPRLAEGADERLGGRAELLPAHASRREAARDHAVRAVDGAELHRGQHRRRHRARQPHAARGVLRRRAEAGDDDRQRRIDRARRSRAARLERHRDRAVEHDRRQARCC